MNTLDSGVSDRDINITPPTLLSAVKDFISGQYLLLLLLQFPFKWTRWFPLVIVVCYGVCLPLFYAKTQLGWVSPNWVNVLTGTTGAIATVLLMLTTLLTLFLMPSQLVHLVTGKQTGLVNSLRSGLYWHIHVITFFYSLSLAAAFCQIGGEKFHYFNMFFLIIFLLSNFLHLSIYGNQKTGVWTFFVGFSVPLYQFFAYKALDLELHWLIAGYLTTWVLFTRWWAQWRPSQHKAALIAETFNDPTRIQRVQSGFGQGIFSVLQFGLNKNIENIFDGLLLGRAKAPLRIMLVALLVPIAMGLSMALSFSLAPGSTLDSIRVAAMANSFMFVMIFITQPVMSLMMVFHNINKVWLLYHGDRKSFFNTLEKLLLTQAGYQMLSIAIFVEVAAAIFLGDSAVMKLYAVALACGLVISVLNTYALMLLYKVASGSRQIQTYGSVILLIFLVIPLGMTGGVIGVRLLTEFGGVVLALTLLLVGIALMLRLFVKSKWQQIEFIRMR